MVVLPDCLGPVIAKTGNFLVFSNSLVWAFLINMQQIYVNLEYFLCNYGILFM